jgi:hypothetical protein
MTYAADEGDTSLFGLDDEKGIAATAASET